MERETFEDEEAAEYLNEAFIPIKVDREERPDIDHIYMEYCQMSTGSGGWPLSVFLTPDKKPFYAGTYFPRDDTRGMPGFITLLHHIRGLWERDRKSIEDHSTKAVSALNPARGPAKSVKTVDTGKQLYEQLAASFDPVYGGFGRAPKFPMPVNLLFLLRYWHGTKEPKAKDMVIKTLDAMAAGGIFDHVGYGFSRYSTDRKWLVPHFEKMLYDNALLAYTYLEAYQAFRAERFADIASKIFEYVRRDMLSEEGAFFSAEDADSEGVEGKYYIWPYEEIIRILGDEAGKPYCRLFNITPEGNFEGSSIPNRINIPHEKDDEPFIEECRRKLFDVRKKRIHPFKDDKILTSWNALMIAAMAYGGRVLNASSLIKTADKALKFIFSNLFDASGRLLSRYRMGKAAIPAYAEDYVFLIWALIELFEADFSAVHIRRALQLCDETIRLFEDKEGGGLYLYGADIPEQIARPKVSYDGVIPSANSVFAWCLVRLARIAERPDLEQKARGIIECFAEDMDAFPSAHAWMTAAGMHLLEPGEHLILACRPGSGIKDDPMLQTVNSLYMPYASIIAFSEGNESLKDIVPDIGSYKVMDSQTTAYLCRKRNCLPPITDQTMLRKELGAASQNGERQ